MATQRVQRLIRLITLLQTGRARSTADLMRELDVSRRTLFRDLHALQAAGVPCYYKRGLGYRIARSFFLPPVDLNAPEVMSLLLISKQAIASQKRPLSAAALSAINKLVNSVPEPVRTACAEMMDHVTFDPGGLSTSDAEARHHLVLQTCIDQKRCCTVNYRRPGDSDSQQFTLSPYALHFVSRAWYVFGATDQHDEVRTLKLARIVALQPADRHFKRPANFRVADKLGKAWRLIPEGKVHKIEVDFMPKVAVNVSEVQWHASQQHTILDDGRCRMKFEVDGLEEIAWWLCGYAGQVVIRKPGALRKRVAEMHRDALALLDGES